MELKELNFVEFNTFAQNHPLGSFYQSSSYALIMGEKGFDYEYIGLFDEMNNMVAASLILFKKIKGKIFYGYAPKGFLVNYEDSQLLKEFTTAIVNRYNERNVAFIKINPDLVINQPATALTYQNINTIKFNLEQNKYLKLKNNLYFESIIPRFNTIVPLKTFNYSNLKKNVRNKVNQGNRKGLVFLKSNLTGLTVLTKMIKKNKTYCDIDLNDFYNVFSKVDAADLFLIKMDYEEFLINARSCYEQELERNTAYNSLLIHNPTEANINAKMNSDLVLLSHKNDILEGTRGIKSDNPVYLAGALVIKYKNTISIVCSSYDRAYARHNANYYLYYKILEHYQADYEFGDLNGITGDFSSTNPYSGLNRFKLGFNPIVVEYIGEHDLIINQNTYSYLQKNNLLAKEFNKN